MSNKEQDIKPMLQEPSTPSTASPGGSEYRPPTPGPSPLKRGRSLEDEDEERDDKTWFKEESGRGSKGKRGGRGGRGGKGRPVGGGRSDGSRNTGAWKKEEVKQLWEALGLLPIKVQWDVVASKVDGRDKLSCSNKWRYDLQPKLLAFIDTLGE